MGSYAGLHLASLCIAAGSVMNPAVLAAKEGIFHETGIAGLHQWDRVGKKVCTKGHWHYTTGVGKSKKQAKAAAIEEWQNFTAWDYGQAWMMYRLSESKAVSCSRTNQGWSCDLQARACKRMRPARKKGR
jgi:hypothetical protein